MDYIKKTIELHNHFGKNDNYVQAAGGNISIKDGDIIHIKKSGLHFKDIKDENDIISLNISKEDINQEVLSIKNKKNLEHQYNDFIDQKNSGKGRPSIELSFHIFGDKYTLHLHPTLINIFTCTKEGQEIIKKMCEENDNMSYVDYYKPGIILTDEILKERSALNEITFLFNHGIIVTGPSENAIKERYKSVEKILKKEIIYQEYKQKGKLLGKRTFATEIPFYGEEPFEINNDFLKEKSLDIVQESSDNIERRNQVGDWHLNSPFERYLSHLYPDSAIYIYDTKIGYNMQKQFDWFAFKNPETEQHKSSAAVFDTIADMLDFSSSDLLENLSESKAILLRYHEGDILHTMIDNNHFWTICVSNKKEATFKTELFINKMKIEYFAKLNGFTPSYLDSEAIDELQNWDAEKYRQGLLR